MNKKGQLELLANPYIIGAVVLIVAIIITYNSGYSKGFSQANETLSEEIKAKEIDLNRLENQLSRRAGELEKKEQEINKTLDKLNNCTSILAIKDNELSTCQNSEGRFPLFWIWNVYLDEYWINIINIYISITLSLFTIKIIFKFVFGEKKRRR